MVRVRNQVAGDRKQSFRRFILSFIKGGRIAKKRFNMKLEIHCNSLALSFGMGVIFCPTKTGFSPLDIT